MKSEFFLKHFLNLSLSIDYETSFTDLLAKDDSFTGHHTNAFARNTQTLLLEIYKIKQVILNLLEGSI